MTDVPSIPGPPDRGSRPPCRPAVKPRREASQLRGFIMSVLLMMGCGGTVRNVQCRPQALHPQPMHLNELGTPNPERAPKQAKIALEVEQIDVKTAFLKHVLYAENVIASSAGASLLPGTRGAAMLSAYACG
jgi:hypothetical protein